MGISHRVSMTYSLRNNSKQMAKKNDVIAELAKLGIAFDVNAKLADLEALLPEGDAVKNEPEDPEVDGNGFVVTDPEVARPKILPLIIDLPKGESWKNDEQAAYAKVLNAAAYCRPEAWSRLQQDQNGKDIPNSAPKHVELKRLSEIGENPSKYYQYTGTNVEDKGNLQFNNKAIGQ